jgi:hypothetical protein
MVSHSFVRSSSRIFIAALVALGVAGTTAGGTGCGPASQSEIAGGGAGGGANGDANCGNGKVDPSETCDTAIASGASACPSGCDDGNACTKDALSGASCTAACAHEAITACVSGDGCCAPGCTPTSDKDCADKCGDGVVSAGETCDIAVKAGKGVCPTSCSSSDACEVPSLVGSGCDAHCVITTTSVAKSGDGCCPAGATHAKDSDCPGDYGDPCMTSAQCSTGVCLTNEMCTKMCTFNGAVNQCGRSGDYCLQAAGGQDICYRLISGGTGGDADDRYIGFGVTYPARIDAAADVDVFIADLPIGVYSLLVTSTDMPGQIDIAVDVYDGGANKIATINSAGVGGSEGGDYTVQAAARSFFVVRVANALQGNYSIRLDKKS